jgi:putative ABC transport system permease protein
VVGTNDSFFEHFRYGSARSLELQSGARFDDVFDAILGSEVAETLGYTVGQSIVVAHGTGNVGLMEHDEQPFVVSGILKRTGTPVDRAVHVSLQGIEAMHVDWQSGARNRGKGTSADTIRSMNLEPKAVTALLLGLKSRGAVFREQRAINTYAEEPLLAILPGVALQELWGLVGVAESALFIVSVCVVVCGLINLITVLLAGLNERRREMAILRSAGARPAHVFLLLCIESTLMTLIAVVMGLGLYYVATLLGGNWLQQQYGINLTLALPGRDELLILGSIILAGLVASTLPALSAYRKSLSDGMAQRL